MVLIVGRRGIPGGGRRGVLARVGTAATAAATRAVVAHLPEARFRFDDRWGLGRAGGVVLVGGGGDVGLVVSGWVQSFLILITFVLLLYSMPIGGGPISPLLSLVVLLLIVIFIAAIVRH